MPLAFVLYGLTFATGFGASVIVNRELTRKPEEGSFFDSINDGVNSVPAVSKHLTIGLVAVAVAVTARAVTKK